MDGIRTEQFPFQFNFQIRLGWFSVGGGVLTLQAIQTDWNPEEYFFLLRDRYYFVNINLYDTMFQLKEQITGGVVSLTNLA